MSGNKHRSQQPTSPRRRQRLNYKSVVEESEEIIQSFNSDELRKLDDDDDRPPPVETVSPDDSTEQPE